MIKGRVDHKQQGETKLIAHRGRRVRGGAGAARGPPQARRARGAGRARPRARRAREGLPGRGARLRRARDVARARRRSRSGPRTGSRSTPTSSPRRRRCSAPRLCSSATAVRWRGLTATVVTRHVECAARPPSVCATVVARRCSARHASMRTKSDDALQPGDPAARPPAGRTGRDRAHVEQPALFATISQAEIMPNVDRVQSDAIGPSVAIADSRSPTRTRDRSPASLYEREHASRVAASASSFSQRYRRRAADARCRWSARRSSRAGKARGTSRPPPGPPSGPDVDSAVQHVDGGRAGSAERRVETCASSPSAGAGDDALSRERPRREATSSFAGRAR